MIIFKRLLSGDIRSNSPNVDRPTFEYQPDGSDHTIPLSASSSLVTEVAALSILNPVLTNSFIIFEEPEAHLHLAAQREMAKIIIQLINSGCYLLITTHSDTFLQQLNNLLLLSEHPQKDRLLEKFNLTARDIVTPDQVSAYDFDCDNDHKTTVRSIEFW
ncbi:AAA family ATPase [Ignatzschineria indica]|uniref:AAA family ATPase n=1 Tax=Ignatzschineria indica TaxID=472583 RepID=UPI0036251A94